MRSFHTSNCPRNFRCYKLSNETAFNNGEVFDPDYKEQVRLAAGRIRHMQWRGVIGDNATNTFDAIPTEAFWSWAVAPDTLNTPGAPGNMNNVPGGTPLTLAYKLSNETRKHAYVNFPKQLGNGKAAYIPITPTGGISRTNPVVITSPNHPFVNGDQITIAGAYGATQANFPTTPYTVANATTNTFELSGINGMSWGTYS